MRTGFLISVLLLSVGCAPQGPPGAIGSNTPLENLTITVDNDFDQNFTLTIRLVGIGGPTRLLGTVTPGSKRTFDVRDVIISTSYVLVAQDGATEVRISRSFGISKPSLIEWRLRRNTLAVRGINRD